ncbi:MAG: hypothetical protein DDT21_01843 [Syntrophomonadaceae bacterium]|nr:hypothetical protein [Bacillota bacterium]
MTITYVLSTNIGKVRLYANDTNVSNAAFSDGELQVFIDGSPSNNLRRAAAWALRTLAFDTARMGRWAEAKVAVDAAASMAVQLAAWLEEQAASVDGISPDSAASYLVSSWAGGINITNKETYEGDDDRVKPAFTRTLHQYLNTEDNV